MKNCFLLYYYISYIFLKYYLSQIIIPFERNFYIKMINQYRKFKNNLIINILIGSEKQNIPLSLIFFEYQHL